MSSSANSFRSVCYRCFKPEVVCICDTIQQISNRTRVLILQHPLERNHPIGTARFATLGLKNSELKVVYGDLEGVIATAPVCAPRTGLLFPSKDAVDLATIPDTEYPETLIVLDGTWYNAGKLYRENPWLQALPHYKLNPASPSRYRIRMEPSKESISTLEAIVAALKIIEPHTDCTSLLNGFDAMIDRQVAYIENGGGEPRYRRQRRRDSRCIPTAIADNFHNVVVLYCEFVRLDDDRRLAVSVCAMRLCDGETFEHFLSLPPSERHRLAELAQSGIVEQIEKEAISHSALVDAWRAFIRPTDVLCAWNKGPLQSVFQIANFPRNPFLFLKAAYGNTVKEKFGKLEEIVAQLQLVPHPCEFTGRAATRMGNAIAMARYLHQWRG